MNIIPVMDLLDGAVVQARAGRREDYAPVRSTLCHSAEPARVLAALLAFYPFDTVYIADLGAITGRGHHAATIADLSARFPALHIWLDDGTRGERAQPSVRPVIGTECGVTRDELLALRARGVDFALSLDFLPGGYAGDPAILADAACWPADVVIMHLPAVGMGRGPDWSFIDTVLARSPHQRWHVGGGVRDGHDIAVAAARGVSGLLVATALHRGTLDREAILRAKKTPA